MKRLSTGVFAALFAACLGLNAIAAPLASASHGNIGTNAIAQASGGMTAAPPANFGSPPSGQIPILFNDHHVYAKPDVLKQGRVLAALVRGGTVLIPLRSMFEQMGATVSYDAGAKMVDVSKPGADVKVTVGKPEVIINGESRPLDVPPMMYQGHVLVPIRVISEGMGAYVQWVPDKQVVVVRYLPPTPPPAPTTAPTEAPTTAPTPTPAPAATPYMDKFIVGDYIFSPRVYDEYNPGTTSDNNNGNGFSYAIRGAIEFNLGSLPWMLEGDYRQFNYPHNCSGAGDPHCNVTTIGSGAYQTFVPAFQVRSYDFDGRLGIRVANPRIYIGVGYIFKSNNTGYPRLSNVGFGIEKLPDLERPFSVYGSLWYYGNAKGNFTVPNPSAADLAPGATPASDAGQTFQLAYNILKAQFGITYSFQGSPLFIDAGVLGDSLKAKTNAPASGSQFGPYLGLGIKF
ncbi:MAG: copper amine oxidase N-terminal domain-containing protein [Candidatus Eremiobacteraeota bacterium]|nr:copper amine oxidase N-terminal domain-containing protein [Candidatus Eremiobacteraeota bacterium]